MTPSKEPIKIAIVADAMGNFRVSQVLIVDLPIQQMERMRAAGQLDCGKRQRISAFKIADLPEAVANQLYAENRIQVDDDDLRFEGAEARLDAETAFAIMQRLAPGHFVAVSVDRTIPCM